MAVTEGPKHLLRYVNSSFCAINGKDARELLGRPAAEALPRSAADSVVDLLDRVFLDGADGAVSCRCLSDPRCCDIVQLYTAWTVPISDGLARGLVIQVSHCPESSLGGQLNTQTHEEVLEINEKLLISSVRQHELVGIAVQSEQRLREYAILLESQKAQLEMANAALLELATTDGLTGLMNARAFQERLREEFDRSLRYQIPFSLILLDVDYFKQFNDAFGHPEGDRVLVEFARILQDCARTSDCVARYGGEEFALILPQTDLQGAVDVAERIRAALHSTCWQKRSITASFGVTAMSSSLLKADDLTTSADEALYRAKASGRNCVCQPRKGSEMTL